MRNSIVIFGMGALLLDFTFQSIGLDAIKLPFVCTIKAPFTTSLVIFYIGTLTDHELLKFIKSIAGLLFVISILSILLAAILSALQDELILTKKNDALETEPNTAKQAA